MCVLGMRQAFWNVVQQKHNKTKKPTKITKEKKNEKKTKTKTKTKQINKQTK
jgi:hypothetical protein